MPKTQSFNLHILKRIAASQALLALLIVFLINGILIATNPLGKFDPERLPSAHSWIWWAAQDFVAQNPPPAIVILGSSLLMNPIQEQDANFLQRDIDAVVEHRCAYLESSLRQTLSTPKTASNDRKESLRCFNFAVPGSLMSDNYMVLRGLLQGSHKPEVIVLGLALRDFIDNEVPCAAATPSYKYLSRYTDTSDLVDLTMPNLWQRWEYWLNRHVYLIGKKLDLQTALSQAASPIAGNFQECRLNAFDMSCYVPGFRSEVERNVWLTKPNQIHAFEDNSPEYKRRYRSPNAKLFECQKTFLGKFCQLAQDSNIHIIIVNMPLTDKHFALMPPGSYSDYRQTLDKVSSQFHLPLLDLNSRGHFTEADFSDTCHMQASGGKKLLDIISAEITRDTQIARSVGIPRVTGKLATFGRTIY